MRAWIAAANWKLNKSPREAVGYLDQFLERFQSPSPKARVLIFPSCLSCGAVAEQLNGRERIGWGGQNCYKETQGAFTGETSAAVLAELGAQSVLLGHSERRSLFFENDELIARKVRTAQQAGLEPMLCVGEHLDARMGGKTNAVLEAQLKYGLSQLLADKPLTIAYEPVWAIGTGQVATTDQAEQAHLFIRETVARLVSPELAEATPILYGGSVKADNAFELARQSQIDGVLVGGASLMADSFLAIFEAGLKAKGLSS